LKIYLTISDDRTHMTGKGSVNEPDSAAKESGWYVEASKVCEPREHWIVTGTFCNEPVFFFRTATERQARERAQDAVDAERELCRPSAGHHHWPHAMPASASEATKLRKRLAAAESEANALRSALLAVKASP
jgi:hypothetical protein